MTKDAERIAEILIKELQRLDKSGELARIGEMVDRDIQASSKPYVTKDLGPCKHCDRKFGIVLQS